MTAHLRPLAELQVISKQIPAYHLTPNTALQHKPLLIYKSAFAAGSTSASQIESHLTATGVVVPQWRYTMYSTSHFHSTTHEVLGIARGTARLCFGHEDNPQRLEATVQAGDVIVIPAGVAHRLLDDLDGGFEMVGSYPPGCQWDMCYGKPGEETAVQAITALEWFRRDPVYGDRGPVLDV